MSINPTAPIYLTTPIYYVNDQPHIGHAYTTVMADIVARYHRLFGDQVFFLTGTDEHGQKVQAAAKARGVSPQAHCDEFAKRYKEIWAELGVAYDIFMRTTLPFHEAAVQAALQELFDRGDIYKTEYEGWYSVSEEIFYTEKDLVDGRSPTGKEVTKVTESNYFFRMSRYQADLQRYLSEHPDFVQPATKQSEVVGFLQQPLSDLCISRPKSRLTWGIELPFDSDYVTYVWFDALLNYATAIGYKQPDKTETFKQLWPRVTHFIGKDILITHTVYWTTMLMALGLPLPQRIFAHGWWLNTDGKKMSKSEGPVVSPLAMKDQIGVEPLRYFLAREVQFGSDALFSPEGAVQRVNTELANTLGNLSSRSISLIVKYLDSRTPDYTTNHIASKELAEQLTGLADRVRAGIVNLEIQSAIGEVIAVLMQTNRYLDIIAPWKIGPTDRALTGESLRLTLEVLRLTSGLLAPVMPTKMAELAAQIGLPAGVPSWSDLARLPGLVTGTPLVKPSPLFPRFALPG